MKVVSSCDNCVHIHVCKYKRIMDNHFNTIVSSVESEKIDGLHISINLECDQLLENKESIR